MSLGRQCLFANMESKCRIRRGRGLGCEPYDDGLPSVSLATSTSVLYESILTYMKLP
jgi:hypothetical protein